MKFVSKFSNHRVVLQPSQPAEPVTGRLATPGISVRFESGTADVHDEDIIEMMLAHPRFKRDFLAPELVEGKGANRDPYAYQRRSMEPEHTMTNIEYGHIGKTSGAKKGILTGLARDKAQQLQKAIDEESTKKAMAMAPELAKQLLGNPEFVSAMSAQIKQEKDAIQTPPREAAPVMEESSGQAPVAEEPVVETPPVEEAPVETKKAAPKTKTAKKK